MSYANKISTARGIKYVKMFVLSEYGRFTYLMKYCWSHHVWHVEEKVRFKENSIVGDENLFKVITLNTYIISKFIIILEK